MAGVRMAKHRKPERRFGNKHVAWHELERDAGRVGDILVIAGGDHAQALVFDPDLR